MRFLRGLLPPAVSGSGPGVSVSSDSAIRAMVAGVFQLYPEADGAGLHPGQFVAKRWFWKKQVFALRLYVFILIEAVGNCSVFRTHVSGHPDQSPLPGFSSFLFHLRKHTIIPLKIPGLCLIPSAFGRKRHKACKALVPIKNAKFSNLFIGGRLFSCCLFKNQGGYI